MDSFVPESTAETDQRRFQLFLVVFTSVAASLPVVLWSLGELNPRSYAIVVLLWLLVSSEVFAPTSPGTRWWSRLQWVKRAGLIVLAYLVFERVAAVVG